MGVVLFSFTLQVWRTVIAGYPTGRARYMSREYCVHSLIGDLVRFCSLWNLSWGDDSVRPEFLGTILTKQH